MNKLDKKLLDILVCPVSKGSLEQVGDELICKESNLTALFESRTHTIISVFSSDFTQRNQ